MTEGDKGRAMWVGNPERFGITQRLGIACFLISFVLVVLAFNAPGHATIRYWLFVYAHGLVYLGFAIAAIADRIARRSFSLERLVLTGMLSITYAVLGPVVMSAAAAGSAHS